MTKIVQADAGQLVALHPPVEFTEEPAGVLRAAVGAAEHEVEVLGWSTTVGDLSTGGEWRHMVLTNDVETGGTLALRFVGNVQGRAVVFVASAHRP